MGYVIVIIVCAVIGQLLGRRKGYQWWGLVLGGLLGLIGIVIVLCLKDKTKVVAAPAPVAQLPRASTDKMYVRVTDKQRDVVVEELSKQFAAGTLDQATFEARMSAATSAVHQHDLDMLTLDLPVLP